MAAPTSEFDQKLRELEAEIKRLEVEYNLFFAGRLPKLPWDTRSRVEGMIKRYDRIHIQNTAERFRFQGLQSRFSAFCELWERAMKSKDGLRPGARRPGMSAPPPRTSPTSSSSERRAAGASTMRMHDPASESDKVRALYDELSEARRRAGEADVPFERFQDVVRAQVAKFGKDGRDVEFKVSVKDGRVAFTAKPSDEAKKDS